LYDSNPIGNAQNIVKFRNDAKFCEIRSAVFEFFRAERQTEKHMYMAKLKGVFYTCYLECAKKGK
jgi:hypothetical protein